MLTVVVWTRGAEATTGAQTAGEVHQPPALSANERNTMVEAQFVAWGAVVVIAFGVAVDVVDDE